VASTPRNRTQPNQLKSSPLPLELRIDARSQRCGERFVRRHTGVERPVINDQEREVARLGIEALNASLIKLRHAPVGENPDVRMVDPVIGGIPNAIVEKPGVAPLRLVFGRDLDIWVGPYSEVVVAPVREETAGHIEGLITRVLMSEVVCRYRRKSIKLILRMPDQDPWLRLRVRGADRESTLELRYAPYARP
jgi:hypothetical protein